MLLAVNLTTISGNVMLVVWLKGICFKMAIIELCRQRKQLWKINHHWEASGGNVYVARGWYKYLALLEWKTEKSCGIALPQLLIKGIPMNHIISYSDYQATSSAEIIFRYTGLRKPFVVSRQPVKANCPTCYQVVCGRWQADNLIICEPWVLSRCVSFERITLS